MSDQQDSLKNNQISRRDFMKLAGAGTFVLGLSAFGIPNILNNIRGASAQGANATNATNATAASAAAPSSTSSDIRHSATYVNKGSDIL
jgi:Ni,Fe-hydrogenase I small subunit